MKHVNFTTCNAAGLDLAINLVKSCKNAGLPITFCALDQKSFVTMQKFCTCLNYYSAKYENLKDFSKYGTKNFNKISYARYIIAQDLLKTNNSITYLDIDIVVCKNFESYILQKLKLNPKQLLIQSNHLNKPCTGFFSLTSNFNSNILNKLINPKNFNLNDQEYLHKLMEEEKPTDIKLLDKNDFPNGAYYYRNHKEIGSSCKIIHFNCVVGDDKKIKKMREYNHYYE